MPSTDPPSHLATFLAVHGLDGRWLRFTTASWLGVFLFGAVALPWRYPSEVLGTVIATGLVIGLLLPAVAFARLLDEGPAHLVLTASRRLASTRMLWSLLLIACQAGIATLAAAGMSATPPLLVVADAVLLTAAAVLSVALFGLAAGWLLPLILVSVFTAPGVVPWNANILYLHTLAPVTAGVAAATSTIAAAAYTAFGSVGLWTRHRGSWKTPDQDT